eukprot:4955064-Amphidinium_carterae.4
MMSEQVLRLMKHFGRASFSTADRADEKDLRRLVASSHLTLAEITSEFIEESGSLPVVLRCPVDNIPIKARVQLQTVGVALRRKTSAVKTLDFLAHHATLSSLSSLRFPW